MKMITNKQSYLYQTITINLKKTNYMLIKGQRASQSCEIKGILKLSDTVIDRVSVASFVEFKLMKPWCGRSKFKKLISVFGGKLDCSIS